MYVRRALGKGQQHSTIIVSAPVVGGGASAGLGVGCGAIDARQGCTVLG
jgi:hypothetical protein